jgi:hypothetical protein
MDPADIYRFDLQGMVVIRNVMTPEEVAAANAALDRHEHEFAGLEAAQDMLGWSAEDRAPFAAMLAHPRVVPYLNEICGRGFRMDHAPTLIRMEAGDGGRLNLHGSSGPGFDPKQCAVLCCAVLCCAALRCAVKCRAALCRDMPRCVALCCPVLRCAALPSMNHHTRWRRLLTYSRWIKCCHCRAQVLHLEKRPAAQRSGCCELDARRPGPWRWWIRLVSSQRACHRHPYSNRCRPLTALQSLPLRGTGTRA